MPTSEKRFRAFSLVGLVAMLFMSGVVWQSYPLLRSTYYRLVGPETKVVWPPTSKQPNTTIATPETVVGLQPVVVVDRDSVVGTSQLEAGETETFPPLTGKPGQDPTLVAVQESPSQTYVCQVGMANIRARPGKESKILKIAHHGNKLHVVGEQGNWLNVRFRDGRAGWIHRRLAQKAE
jgi:uncharacterized protein YgiM (DUF1202 family)